MQTHGIRVGLPDHLAEDVELPRHLVDVSAVLLRQLLQLVGSLGKGSNEHQITAEISNTVGSKGDDPSLLVERLCL